MLPQGKAMLCSQGLLDKLLSLIPSPFGNVRTAAAQCLVQLITTTLLRYFYCFNFLEDTQIHFIDHFLYILVTKI